MLNSSKPRLRTYVQRSTLELTQVPHSFVTALIAGEDHRFIAHRGIDPIAMGGAFYRLIAHRKIGGASTIEQQFVRVVTGLRERTLAGC